MDFFIEAFNTVLYEPLFNILVLFYKYIPGHDFGVAVILLTVLVKLLTLPLGDKAIRSQKALAELQPKIKEIQEKYKNDRASQARATMELYKKEKINPFSGFFSILVQLPILFALYQVFWKGLRPDSIDHLYGFIGLAGSINSSFLGMVNLASPSWILAILAGISQFFQSKTAVPPAQKTQGKEEKLSQFSGMMQKQMLYFFPAFTVLIVWKLPSAIALYWITTSIFSIVQQYFIFKKKNVQ